MAALALFALLSPLPGCEESIQSAIAALQQHEFAKENVILEDAAARCSHSSDSRVLFTLGSLFGERGNYKRAAEYLSRIPERDTDDAVSFNLGLCYSHLRQFEKARAAYFKAIDSKPGHTEAYFRIGLDYATQGESRKAIPWLFRAWELSGNRPDITCVLAEQLLRLKYAKTAEEVINTALGRSPHDPLLTVAAGDVLQQRGDYTAAISKYQDALSRQPRLPAASIGLAQVAMAQGDLSAAQSDLLQALDADPANPSAHGELGILAGRQGDWASAATHLKTAWEEDRSSITGLELARALRHCGRLAEALPILKSLEPRMRDSSAFHLELAALYAQLHKTADAQAERAIAAKMQSEAHGELHFEDAQTYVH